MQFNEVLEKHPEANSSLVALTEKWKAEAINLLREQNDNPTTNPKKEDDSEDE